MLIPLPLKPLSDGLNRSISILIDTGIRPPSPIGVTQSYAKKDATMTTDRSHFADDWVSAVLTRPGWGVAHDLEYMIASGVRDDLLAEDDAPETVGERTIDALFFFGRTLLRWFAIVGMGAVLHAPNAVVVLLAAVITGLGIVYDIWEKPHELWS